MASYFVLLFVLPLLVKANLDELQNCISLAVADVVASCTRSTSEMPLPVIRSSRGSPGKRGPSGSKGMKGEPGLPCEAEDQIAALLEKLSHMEAEQNSMKKKLIQQSTHHAKEMADIENLLNVTEQNLIQETSDTLMDVQGRIAKVENRTDTLVDMQSRLTKLELAEENRTDTLVEAQNHVINLELADEVETASYELRLTPRTGNFDETREMCRQMGGDLMQKTLLTSTPGGSYREKLRSFGITPEHKYLFIGITDQEVEGTWTFINGDDFIEANSISNWDLDYNEPNGGRIENCGTAVQYVDDPETPYPYFRLNDFRCNSSITWQLLYGVCEIKI